MANDPVDLDGRRGMEDKKSTELRRDLNEVREAREALAVRQSELEQALLAGPAANWHEAAVKMRYLLDFFAASPEARDPRRKRLIESLHNDIDRLCEPAEDER